MIANNLPPPIGITQNNYEANTKYFECVEDSFSSDGLYQEKVWIMSLPYR